MSYETILNSITVGNHTKYPNNDLSQEQAADLLAMAVSKFNLKKCGAGDCYEGNKYFAYVGSFPVYHLALDNKAGTTRLHTITTKSELDKIKP